MVVVDDFIRYTWVILLRSKSNAPEHIEALCTRLQNENNMKIDQIRSDQGKEFENSYMESFCTRSSISQEHTQEGVIIRMPKLFLYEDSHRFPWKYDVSLISI